MRVLLSLLLLMCYVLQRSSACTVCNYGVAAESPLAQRYADNETDAAAELVSLQNARFTGINSTTACNTLNLCGSNATCENITSDVYKCTCDQYFESVPALETFSCNDIDECSSSATNNCSSNAACTNESPGFSCACNAGFTGDGVNCTDISECASNPCAANATCAEPQANNHTCTCISGYTGDAYSGNCTDINECSASNLNDCDANATCTNLDTTYNCSCNAGYSGNGTYCEDINECASNPCTTYATCNEPVADNYTCTCNSGFDGDGYTSCVRARQMINITFIITCTGLNFDSALQDNSSSLYTNVTTALRTAIDTFTSAVDSGSNVDTVTYSFTNSSDGLGNGQAEVTVSINNTDQLESVFLARVHEISESAECTAVASTDECTYNLDDCDSGRSCVDTDFGYCCYHDITYTASVILNATYNASIHGDINSTESQNICNAVQSIIQTRLDAKEDRGCGQSIAFDCSKLISGSVEAVLHLSVVNATYTVADIASELQKAINSTTSFGTVIGAGDFDECSDQYEAERNCSAFADCLNFAGNFSCDCNATYYDNGTTPGEICISPVTVNCGSSNISISIVSAYYTNQGINISNLHLANENCNFSTHGRIVGDSVEFTVSINDCNTTLSTSSDNSTVVASNYISNLPSSGVFTGTEINVPFECELPASLNISAQFNGGVAQVNLPNVVATGGFTLDFDMFDSAFTTAYPSGQTFSSNEIIYGQISISNTISDVSVKMERCWGTPTSNSADSEFLEYLTNGCSSGQATNFNLIANGDGSARFSFQMFFFTQVNSVYLHCEVQVCTPSCISTCPSKRRRRQASERTEEVTISFLLRLDQNDPQYNNRTVPIIGIINTNEPPSESGSSTNDITLAVVSAVLAFVLIVVLAILVIVAVRKHRASKQSYDTTHVNMHAIGVKPPEY